MCVEREMDENAIEYVFHVNEIRSGCIILAFELHSASMHTHTHTQTRSLTRYICTLYTRSPSHVSLHELLCAVSMIVAHLYLAKGYK